MRLLEDIAGPPPDVPLQIIEDSNCAKFHHEQVRFPRSRKVRMRRKWAKNPRNWRDRMEPLCIQVKGLGYVCHPLIANHIRKNLSEGGPSERGD